SNRNPARRMLGMLRAIISEPCAPSTRYGAHHHLGIRTSFHNEHAMRLLAKRKFKASDKAGFVPNAPICGWGNALG
ncbi:MULTISPECIES: hypothetical protein, partial [unclassified Bradyrhizobium]